MWNSYRDLSAHPGGLADLVLSLLKCLVTGILRLTGSFREKEYPALTVRACDGLSSDTPAGYKISRAVPAVVDNLTLDLIKMHQPRV